MFSILFVCSGNQHRSPAAAAFVRRLTAGLPVEVASAGTLGIEGSGAAPEVVSFCASVGADASGHRSRGLGVGDARRADLVCGFELAHVSTAVIDGGAAHVKTFTLVELVDLLNRIGSSADLEPEARAVDRVARAHVLRAQGAGFVPGLEIADPIERSRAEQRRTLQRIWDLCNDLVTDLFVPDRP